MLYIYIYIFDLSITPSTHKKYAYQWSVLFLNFFFFFFLVFFFVEEGFYIKVGG